MIRTTLLTLPCTSDRPPAISKWAAFIVLSGFEGMVQLVHGKSINGKSINGKPISGGRILGAISAQLNSDPLQLSGRCRHRLAST
jgi:hypothetical protein